MASLSYVCVCVEGVGDLLVYVVVVVVNCVKVFAGRGNINNSSTAVSCPGLAACSKSFVLRTWDKAVGTCYFFNCRFEGADLLKTCLVQQIDKIS